MRIRQEEHYWRNLATRLAFVIITVALIVWFMPRNEKQQFRYDVGKPWMYGSFIAKFDFPIYKTDETMKSPSSKTTLKMASITCPQVT